MRRRKGFTLIELLLVVIGIALVLAVVISLLQIPSREMSTSANISKIISDARFIETAWNRYYLDQGAFTTNLNDLTSAGYMKAIPTPSQNAKDSAYTGTYAYSIDSTSFDIAGTSAKDYVLKLCCVTQDVCHGVNSQVNISSIGTSPQANVAYQCYRNGAIASGNGYTVLYLLRAQ